MRSKAISQLLVESPARLFIVVALVLWGLATHGTHAGTGDEPHYLAIAHSLAFDGDADLANNYGRNEPLIADGELRPELHVRDGRGGVRRPVHDIGLPLIAAPYVRLASPAAATLADRAPEPLMRRFRLTPSTLYRHLISALMIVFAGTLAMLLMRTATAWGIDRGPAFWGALLVVCSPPVMIHGILFFTELLSALLTLAVFYLIVFRPAGTWPPLAAGLATGALVLVHIRNGPLAVALAALAAVRFARAGAWRTLVPFLGAVVVMAAARTAVTYHFWGTWLTTPHARLGYLPEPAPLAETVVTRLAGLLVDQEYGLLPYAPVYLLALWGARPLYAEHRTAFLVLAIAGAAYMLALLLPVTNVYGWTQGWSPAGRFLVPILPLAALLAIAGIRRAPRPVAATILVAQVLISAYFWHNPKDLWNDGDGVAAICARHAALCAVLPSLAANPAAQAP